jgi:hypothetical protein
MAEVTPSNKLLLLFPREREREKMKKGEIKNEE